tara:strand:- start:3654 stop:3977 length:324 start_codon:yes stop_codon:yes gene_type:complete
VHFDRLSANGLPNDRYCQPTVSSTTPKICYKAPVTMLEKFMAFAKGLPADRLESVEITLAQIMESHSEKYDLTPDQLAELDRRVAEERPEFSNPEDITKLFGKPFSA